jgi:hypothetical protein
VWRTVDRLYLDRSFNGVDWFDLRQKTIAEAAKPLNEDELNKVGVHCTAACTGGVMCVMYQDLST